MTSAPLLPGFEIPVSPSARKDAIDRAWHLMRLCWPSWKGPAVTRNPLDPAGRIEISAVIAHSLTHGGPRYAQMVPCRLIEISADRETYVAETAYPATSHCAHLNGQRWRLDVTEIWPPVALLRHH